MIAPDGKHFGTIRTPESVTNLAFGDADRKTLYITARPTIYKIVSKSRGLTGQRGHRINKPRLKFEMGINSESSVVIRRMTGYGTGAEEVSSRSSSDP